MYPQNGQIDHSPSLQTASPYTHTPGVSYRHRSRDEPVIRYTDSTGQSSHHPHRGRREHRSDSRSRSRSHSRTSTASIDDMLIEATTGDDRADINGMRVGGQHLSPNAHGHRRHRSLSHEREYLVVPQHHPRSRGATHHSLHPSGSMSGMQVPQGPGVPGNSLPPFQTHIFAPPVTGAPVKKSEYRVIYPSHLNSLTLAAPTSGTLGSSASIGGGGFPPTNAQGQRICRQCGLPGRYKDGKCVEKWGPGPEGPGTVCDR